MRRLPHPTPFGEYDLQGLLEQGRTSAIYIAKQQATNEMVALKILLPEFSQNKTIVTLFQQEMSLSQLPDHPNVVKTISSGIWNNYHYIVMELLSGESLKKILKKQPISLQRALDLIVQLCQAVSYLHEHGMVHGDIKPENLLVTSQGQLKLIDFGIADWAASSALQARPTTLKGTPLYMSPELIQGLSSPTPQSDIYAIGIVAYELLMSKITHGQVLLSLVPQGFQSILSKALQPDPNNRYTAVRELTVEIAKYIQSGKLKSDKHGTDYYIELYDQLETSRQSLIDLALLTPLNALHKPYGLTISAGIGLQGVFLGFNERERAFCFSVMPDIGLQGVLQSYQFYEQWKHHLIDSSTQLARFRYTQDRLHIDSLEWGHLFIQHNTHVQRLSVSIDIPLHAIDRIIYVGLSLIHFHEFPSTPQAPLALLIQEAVEKTVLLVPQQQTEALLQHIRLLGGGILESSPIVILSFPIH